MQPVKTPVQANPIGVASTGQRYSGIYKGQVVGAIDPAGQGRLQVSIPSIGIAPSWAQVCGSPSGYRVGSTAVIGFLDGDPNYPIVLGFI